MKKLYRYINENELNEYEKENKRLSYANLFYKNENLFLCNNIVNVDETLFENVENGVIYDEETDEYEDIYQYYLIDDMTAERLKDYTDEIVMYSDKLDCYVLGVTHWGTSWTYVLTDIELEYNDELKMYEAVVTIDEEDE